MVQQPIEDISQALDDIEARVEYIESSQDRTFALIENETLSSFHYFNLCLKLFWDDFDRNSVSNLMQYQYIVERYSDLRNRYITLFRERISYWDEVLNLDTESVQKLAPFILVDDSEQKVIGYYNRFLSRFKNKKGEPLYKIDENTNPSIIFVDEKGNPRKHYALHSDILNFGHYRSLDSIRNCLKYIFDMMDVVCSYLDEYFSKYKPTQEDIICALENGLRQYAKDVGNKVERQLKITTQKLKPSRSAPLTPEVWGEMMNREDAMFDQAIRTQVGEIEDEYLENISVTKIQLIDNYALLQKIKTTCLDGELFDIRLSVKTHQLLTSLDYNNLDFFYELVLRRNIIQREMFPEELRDKYEEWLNPVEETQEENSDEESTLSFARQSKLDEIIEIFQRGNWKQPATVDNIEQLLNTVFGKNISLLDDADLPTCEKMWSLVEGGRGDRIPIISANLAGYFAEQNLLQGTPKEISNDLFGNKSKQSNNINKGKMGYRSGALNEVIPFLNEYIDKIIRQK